MSTVAMAGTAMAANQRSLAALVCRRGSATIV
jgi:hypothetical protein